MQFDYFTDSQQITDLIDFHNKSNRALAIDLETTGLDVHKDSITKICMTGYELEQAIMFEPEHISLLSNLNNTTLVFQNFKFDLKFLHKYGIDLLKSNTIFDTMLLHHLIDENASHGLEDQINLVFNESTDYKTQFWDKYKQFDNAPLNEQLEYVGKDVIYTLKLYYSHLFKLFEQNINLKLVSHVHKLASALYKTELTGIKVDLGYLMKTGEQVLGNTTKLLADMRQQVWFEAGIIEQNEWLEKISQRKTDKGKQSIPKPVFNFDSSAQLGRLLYDELGLPEQLSKTRSRTVDDGALEKLSDRHPIIPLIRDYRGNRKVYTSYIEGTLDRMVNNRIYPSFNVNGTVTGRISSSQPNMQQLPKSGGIRGIYIPDEGYKLISCDYGQLEVVIAAHYSQDKNLLKIIYEGASKHDITNESLGLKDRGLAKTINFAMQYLCGWQKIQKLTNTSEKEAKHIWNKYWETYSGEKSVVDQCKTKVDKGEPIINLFGRHRRFPVKFENHWKKEAAYRQAYSALIQGSGSDCTHYAFYNVAEKMADRLLGNALFEVHDEILIMSKNTHCAESRELLISEMTNVTNVINLTVPLTVDCSEPMDRWED